MVDSIQEKAREIGRQLAHTDEYKALKRANELIADDREAVAVLNRLGTLEADLASAIRSGELVDEDSFVDELPPPFEDIALGDVFTFTFEAVVPKATLEARDYYEVFNDDVPVKYACALVREQYGVSGYWIAYGQQSGKKTLFGEVELLFEKNGINIATFRNEGFGLPEEFNTLYWHGDFGRNAKGQLALKNVTLGQIERDAFTEAPAKAEAQ